MTDPWMIAGRCVRVVVVLFVIWMLAACGAPQAADTRAAPASAEAPASEEAAATPASAAQPALPVAAEAGAADTGEAAPQLPATVADLNGQTVTVESVERIVSLTGDITEIVFALGMGDYVVGVDSSATYPPEQVQALPNIGYQRRLNAEGIIALNPTLVIGDEAAGPPEVLAQLQTAGVPVALVADPPTLAAPAQKIRFVAQALGVPQRGEALAAKLDAAFATAQSMLEQATSPQPRVLFLYLRGAEVQHVAGTNTSADVIISAAGGINAGAEVGIDGFKPLSPETLVAAQPDVFLVLTKGLESVGGVEGLLQIPGMADTPAGQQRRIVDFDDLYLLGMGPRTGLALQELIVAFHPELATTGRP
jgi:iron complex transport system substrate-binding protein